MDNTPNESCVNLEEEFHALKNQYETLLIELDTLKQEYSENTVIESMNDMKERYNELMRTSVSLYKYKELETKCTKLHQCVYSMLALISHVKKFVNEIDAKLLYDRQNTLSRVKNDLSTMQDIIEDAIEE